MSTKIGNWIIIVVFIAWRQVCWLQYYFWEKKKASQNLSLLYHWFSCNKFWNWLFFFFHNLLFLLLKCFCESIISFNDSKIWIHILSRIVLIHVPVGCALNLNSKRIMTHVILEFKKQAHNDACNFRIWKVSAWWRL